METSPVITEARERFRAAADAEAQWRPQCLDDLRFSIGEIDGKTTQWRAADVAKREQEGRPAITINRQQQFIRQVTNEIRQNNPSIRVSPVDDGADIETAEIFQGIIRHIEVASFADIARATASHHMATCGIGYTRIRTEYCDDRSFDQELRIDRVLNPFSVYFDPGAQEPDKSDALYAFQVSDITHEQHKRMFPKTEVSSATELSSIGSEVGDWIRQDGIRIAEYFSVEFERRKLVLVEIGGMPLVAFLDELKGVPGFDPQSIRRERDVEVPRVMHRKINGVEELEKTVWPGRYIPLIPYLGEEYIIEGRKHISGMVRSARPAQYMYNFWVSALTEMIALMNKSPWIVAEGQTEGYEAMWDVANKESFSHLIYKPTTFEGHLVGPPQRAFAEPPIQAITTAILQADRDMKATFGIYEAGLGQRGPQESGRAIEARKVEGDVSNFHMIDNVSRGRRFEGRQLIDLIPKVYDRERVVQIIGADDTPDTIVVNSAQPVKYKGIERIYDLKAGRYDVAISVGPGYQTKRQQAAEQIANLINAYPEIMAIAGDLLVKATDIPYAQEIAERQKKMLPPQLQDDQQQPQIPPEVQAQLQQSQAALEFVQKQVMELAAKLEDKSEEIASKERIASMNNETKLMIEQMQIESEEKIAALKADMERISRLMDANQSDEDREFARESSEEDRRLQRESGDKEREVKLQTAASKAKNGGGDAK